MGAGAAATTSAPMRSPETRVRDAAHRDLAHVRMGSEHLFDLERRDVDAATDDPVVEPAADADVAVGIQRRLVAGREPAVRVEAALRSPPQ